MTIITNTAELLKNIDAWAKAGQKWIKQGHILAMSALHILEATGDVGPVNRLYLAMPKGTKSSAMAEWLLSFGKLSVTEGENAKTKPFSYDKAKTNNLAGAAAKPWYEFKPEPTVVELYDAHAAMMKAIQSIKSAAAKAQSAKGLETIARIEELLNPADEAGEADPLAGLTGGEEPAETGTEEPAPL